METSVRGKDSRESPAPHTRLSVLPLLGALPAPLRENERKQSPPTSITGERQSNHFDIPRALCS